MKGIYDLRLFLWLEKRLLPEDGVTYDIFKDKDASGD